MNWLSVIVLTVIVLSILRGYQRGLLRMVYSMVSWIVVLALVAWATPYINSYLLEKTTVYEQVAKHCEEVLRQSVGEKILQPDSSGESQEESAEPEIKLPGLSAESQEELAKLGVKLPENVLTSIAEQTAASANDFLEGSGLYSEMADGMARFIIQGISSLTALILAGIAVQIISGLLGVVSHIPVIKGANRIAGLFVGGLYGMIIVWVAFYVIALCSTGETGSTLVSYIYASPFLTMLYENNPVISVMLHFFG